MKTLGVTQYEVVDDEQGKYVLIYNGFSSCFKLFNFDKHIFSRIDALTGPTKGSDISKISEYTKEFDRVYCSLSTGYELEYIRPALDERWVLGGPLIQETNVDLNVPCETTKKFAPEYFGVSDHDYTDYSPYFDQIMRLYPKRRALVHAYIGGSCYWNNCTFCRFDTGRRPPLTGDKLTRFLENTDKSSSYTLSHLANPALLPTQLKTVLEYSPKKKNWIQLFAKSGRKINDVLEKFDNNELKNILVGLGLETTSETLRNNVLKKDMRDKDIYETVKHVVRLGGSLEISVMGNYFSATKECVEESEQFVRKLEELIPPEKCRPSKIDSLVEVRWPVRTRKWLESLTDFEIKEDYEKEFGKHYKVVIPKDSEVYRYNQKMGKIFNTATFNTNEFDMYMGDPNV